MKHGMALGFPHRSSKRLYELIYVYTACLFTVQILAIDIYIYFLRFCIVDVGASGSCSPVTLN